MRNPINKANRILRNSNEITYLENILYLIFRFRIFIKVSVAWTKGPSSLPGNETPVNRERYSAILCEPNLPATQSYIAVRVIPSWFAISDIVGKSGPLPLDIRSWS